MIQFMKGFMLVPIYAIGSGKMMWGSTYFFANKSESLQCLTQAAELGNIKPLIDKVYAAKDIKEVVTYVVNEHPQGKVVIKMDF